MRNNHFKTVFAGFLLLLASQQAIAQFDVHYGQTRRYMFWPTPERYDVYNSKNNTTVSKDYPEKGGGQYETAGSMGDILIGNPFNNTAVERDSSCTIYGFASPITDEANTPDPFLYEGSLWTHDCTLDFYVYKVTPDDSILELVTNNPITFHVNNGETPDRRMIISDRFLVGDDTFRRNMYLQEFYLDEPITITGAFFVGLHSSPRTKICSFIYDELRGIPYDTRYNYCVPGYVGYVDPKNSQLTRYNALCTHSLSHNNVSTNIVPDIERDTILKGTAQIIYPILVPQGTVLGIEGPKESPSVIRLLPNPSRSITTIQSDHPINAITLTDLLGRTLISKTCHNEETSVPIDISGLPVGIYTVKVQTSQGTATEKLLVK